MNTAAPLPEMPCAVLVESVTDYLEDALSADDRARFDAHLLECDDCVVYFDQLRWTLRVTGHVGATDITPEMRTELTDAFRHRRRDA